MKRVLSVLLAFFFMLAIFAVPVTVQAMDYYTVTVTGGSGSGQYNEGETVTITADGQMNYLGNKWTSTQYINYTNNTSRDLAKRTFDMPAHDVDIHIMYYPSTETADLKEAVVSTARSVIGRRYVYGMAGPKDFDNSGLLHFCHKMAGTIIPRIPSEIYTKLINYGFYTEYETISYLAENGVFRHQPEPGDIVVLYETQEEYDRAVQGSNSYSSAYFSIYTGRSDGTDKVIAIFDSSAPVSEYSVGNLANYGYGVGVFHIGTNQVAEIFDKSEVYNGLPVDFEVAKPGGVTSVKYEYEGKGDTAYAKSETAPANVGNYTVTASFTMVDGCTQIAPISATLTISARPVTISPQEQTIIYGDTISQTEFTASGLVEGHRATVILTPSTNEVTTDGTVTAGDARIFANDLDVTANYEISYGTPANLTISARPVTISPQEQTIIYGDTISQTEFTVSGLVEGHRATVILTPSTNEVTTDGTVTAGDAKIFADDLDVTASYEISYGTPANLTIQPDITAYDIVHGNNGMWTKQSNLDLSFTADGPYDKFAGIKVDGQEVDAKYYDAASGSTIITLKESFLEQLDSGEHTITILYTDGETTGTFMILEASASIPATGEKSNVEQWTSILCVSYLALVTLMVRKKNRKTEN